MLFIVSATSVQDGDSLAADIHIQFARHEPLRRANLTLSTALHPIAAPLRAAGISTDEHFEAMAAAIQIQVDEELSSRMVSHEQQEDPDHR